MNIVQLDVQWVTGLRRDGYHDVIDGCWHTRCTGVWHAVKSWLEASSVWIIMLTHWGSKTVMLCEQSSGVSPVHSRRQSSLFSSNTQHSVSPPNGKSNFCVTSFVTTKVVCSAVTSWTELLTQWNSSSRVGFAVGKESSAWTAYPLADRTLTVAGRWWPRLFASNLWTCRKECKPLSLNYCLSTFVQ